MALARRPAPLVALLAGIALVSAASAAGGSSGPGSPTVSGSPAASTADATASTPEATAQAVVGAVLTQHVDAGPLSLDVPANWHVRRGLLNPSGNATFAYLSPGAVPGECEPLAGGGGVCHPWPIVRLQPGDIVIAVRFWGMPGTKPPARGDRITVAGMPARRISGPADDACQAIGGSQSVVVVLESLPDTPTWMSIDACVAGPDVAAADDAFDASVASVKLASDEPSEPASKPASP